MGSSAIKNYQFIIGLFLLIIGILIFSFLPGPIRYLGFVFIFGAAGYYIFVSSANHKNEAEDDKFKSRVRNQMQKHHHRIK